MPVEKRLFTESALINAEAELEAIMGEARERRDRSFG